ncbi:hypothetical protein [Legionella antarctica]|uniref:hypothetical protein n=1 Tax=Legionella antarctica TaxID=2708020 RepID=UPI0015643E56|nr:hypothetical protein [Legionella antarctica]
MSDDLNILLLKIKVFLIQYGKIKTIILWGVHYMGKKYNLVLSLFSNHESTELLRQKCEQKNGITDTISIEFDGWCDIKPFSLADQLKFKKLTGSSHLYIHGHGGVGCDFLGNNNDNYLFYKSLAEIIVRHVNLNKIAGLHIRLFFCHSSASLTVTADTSFASKLMDHLRFSGINNIKLIGNTDSITIIQNPHTKKIYSYMQTDIEKNIRDQYKLNRTEALNKAKSVFLLHLQSLNSIFFDEETLRYIDERLLVEIMLDRKKTGEFIADLCGFILQRGFLTLANSMLLITLVGTLAKAKEKLETLSVEYQSTEFDNTMRQLKSANFARPNAKILFQWDGENKVNVDCYESKRHLSFV